MRNFKLLCFKGAQRCRWPTPRCGPALCVHCVARRCACTVWRVVWPSAVRALCGAWCGPALCVHCVAQHCACTVWRAVWPSTVRARTIPSDQGTPVLIDVAVFFSERQEIVLNTPNGCVCVHACLWGLPPTRSQELWPTCMSFSGDLCQLELHPL